MAATNKTCTKCGVDKPVTAFHLKRSGRPDPYQHQCKSCVKSAQLMRKYGIDNEGYQRMFEAQRGCCDICGVHQNELERALAVDHDHETGQVRSLLCGHCNVGLGHFQDQPELLKAAAEYLRGFEVE